MTTTSYGTWNNRVDNLATGLEHTVYESLGSYADEYDSDTIAAEYRAAIDAALPASVNLCGDEFIGPYYDADADFAGYPLTDDGSLDIAAIVEAVDLWAIIGRHDKAA